MTDDVNVKFGAETADLDSGIAHVKDKIAEVGAAGKEFASSIKEVGEAVVAAFAVEKISQFFEKMAELGTQTERTAAMLGISTEQVGEFSAIALASGGSADGMTRALERMAMGLQRAKEGTGPAAAGFKALGLNAKELIGLPLQDVLDKIANKFAGMNDGLNKTAIAMAILGRGGAEMIPVLDRGAQGMAELGQIAVRAGSAMDSGTVRVLTQMHEAIVELGLSLQGIGITMANAFGPSITAIVGALTDLVQWFNNSLKAGGLFEDGLKLLAGVADVVATALLGIVFAIEAVAQTAAFAWNEIHDVMRLSLTDVKKDFETWQNSMLASGTSFMTRLKALWGAAGAPEGKGGKKDTPSMDLSKGGKDTAATVAAAEMDGEIKVLQQGLATKKILLETELAQHKITKAQELQAEQDYVDDTYGTSREILTSEMALWAEGTKQYQAALNKRNELDAKYATDSAKITLDLAKDQEKTITKVSNDIQSAFNSQLKGLLAGTTSWSQAFKNIMGDLVIKVIEYFEKIAVDWVVKQAVMTAANVAGNTARTASDATAAATSSALTVSTGIESIMASAAKTFAGIFGFLSPAMGPAAAGPAAIGEATVAASAAALYEQGTPWVPSDGIAMLHKGEAVIPASANAAGLGGGSGGLVINLGGFTANGAMTEAEIKGHARAIARTVADHWRTNPTTRPAY
jgi:hypothetical protein